MSNGKIDSVAVGDIEILTTSAVKSLGVTIDNVLPYQSPASYLNCTDDDMTKQLPAISSLHT